MWCYWSFLREISFTQHKDRKNWVGMSADFHRHHLSLCLVCNFKLSFSLNHYFNNKVKCSSCITQLFFYLVIGVIKAVTNECFFLVNIFY